MSYPSLFSGSIHYPSLASLPTIATVQLTKVRMLYPSTRPYLSYSHFKVKEFTLKKTFAIENKPLKTKAKKYRRFFYEMVNDQESMPNNTTKYMNEIGRVKKQRYDYS